MHDFGLEKSAEPSDGPTGCGEVGRRGCLFAWNFAVTRSTVLDGGGGKDFTNHDAIAALATRS